MSRVVTRPNPSAGGTWKEHLIDRNFVLVETLVRDFAGRGRDNAAKDKRDQFVQFSIVLEIIRISEEEPFALYIPKGCYFGNDVSRRRKALGTW